MYSILYISAFIGVIVFAALLVHLYRQGGRLYGRTLSQWIDKTRRRSDEQSAENLANIRKRFETLAHDVLKHRLLGLASLIEEIRDELKKTPKLPEEKLETYRVEFFRLAGLKISPEERLWTRWQRGLNEIYHYANKNTLAPPLDPMFQDTVRLMMAMRALTVGIVADESFDNQFIERITSLPFERCIGLYPRCIELAAACRMVIHPDDIMQKSLNMLAAQSYRGDARENVQIFGSIGRQLLCPAPTNTLVMCLTRLLDNALNAGRKAAVDIEVSTDAFTGESYLIIKVYDASDHLPVAGEYGAGIRGIQQSVTAFEGGFQYRREERDGFKKAAVISFPVSEYSDFTITHQKVYFGILTSLAPVVFVAGFILCLLYVLGGPPVGFGGKGETIMEFTVSVGEELVIPLCEGGRNVRVETQSVNEVCLADNCSFGQVLNALEPCANQIDDPQCPGEIRWTPQFMDGQRQGKNYELTVHCIADGPPMSEDLQRIRVIVTRPNSVPKVIVTQLFNETRGEMLNIEKNRTLKVGATDKLVLRALAADDDADMLTYRLRMPGGQTQVSNDGIFHLNAEWSSFATSTFELEISDNIAPPIVIPVILEADTLRPVEMRSATMWASDNTTRMPCDGTADSKICYITERAANRMDIQLWFDPLLPKVRPILDIQVGDEQMGIGLQASKTNAPNYTQIGDQWEIYRTDSGQIVSFIELVNIEKTNEPGVYQYTFNYIAPIPFGEVSNIPILFKAKDQSNRLPELNASLFFVKKAFTRESFSLSTRYIKLRESENETAGQGGRLASVWVYPTQENKTSESPSIGGISCQIPEFAEAFEKPEIKDHRNAWRIDFKLKRGCIPGLAMDLPEKSRVCSADIQFGAGNVQSNALWIMLEPTSCEPHIDELKLISGKEELAANLFKWRFHITDTDGDVDVDDVGLTELTQYELVLEKKKESLGSDFSGMLTFSLSCDMQNVSTIQQNLALRVRDRDAHETLKPLFVPLSCPSLVGTADGMTSYEIDDQTHLEIPLVHERDVRLTLNSRFGAIVNDKFVWDVSCLYGRGPHIVEIQTESPVRYGSPFQFELQIRHCQPHFSIRFDHQAYGSQTPIFLTAGTPKDLEIQIESTDERFRFIPASNAAIPNVRLSPKAYESGPSYEIACDKPGVVETLRFQIVPEDDDGSLMGIEPIDVDVFCVEP